MAKKSKAAGAATVEEMDVLSPQGSAHGSEGGGEKEGSFLLGQPTWEDAGGGRWRCAETGHELPEREKEAYARSRACRLALIDNAVARKKPPLNAFKPHPEHKSKLICSITGDIVNKSEKHINGKRFLNKLVLWWGAYGGLAFELQSLAKRIVSLCCSASGCERNWSTFSHIHTKKRNRLEHQKLNKLVYVSYNRKMTNRFLKLRELGSKGKKCNPLILDEFQWESEWVDSNCEQVHQGSETGCRDGRDDLTWTHVDEAIGASHDLRGRNLPRVAAAAPKYYGRKRKNPTAATEATQQDQDIDLEEIMAEEQDVCDEMEEDDDSGIGTAQTGQSEDAGEPLGFQLDAALDD